MGNTDDPVDQSVIEFLDLARIESPFTPNLLTNHRRKLIQKLLKSNKIDQETADYLLTS
ncbi:hypothetical protein ACFL2V_09790 [Pseudomonadota bacterium]